MKEFKFDYDEENDDLFVYLDGIKSKGAVELGNFIFDFDEKENLVSLEITEASKVLSKLVAKIIYLNKINKMRADIINFRNMNAIRIELQTDSGKESANIVIPRVREDSPALGY